jgi:hypothetical protein
MTGHFLWVASDSWGTKRESVNSNELAAEGAITFSPKTFILQGNVHKIKSRLCEYKRVSQVFIMYPTNINLKYRCRFIVLKLFVNRCRFIIL